jgi:hypothetical protein
MAEISYSLWTEALARRKTLSAVASRSVSKIGCGGKWVWMRSLATQANHGFSRLLGTELERGGGSMQLTVACFDESGKFNDSDVVAFSGCASTQSGIDKFAEDWGKNLREKGISHLSMKDALRFEGPFAGWEHRTAERDDILRSFAHLTSKIQRFSAPLLIRP